MAEPELDRTEARQGRTRGIARYVLAVSLALAIAAMIGAYVFVV